MLLAGISPYWAYQESSRICIAVKNPDNFVERKGDIFFLERQAVLCSLLTAEFATGDVVLRRCRAADTISYHIR